MILRDGRTHFRVWAPYHDRVDLHLHDTPEELLPMTATGEGYYEALIERDLRGCRYTYALGGGLERPDPASRLQHEGVHGASSVVGDDFRWSAREWRGVPLSSYIIYELHVGAFTAQGDFDAAIERIPYLQELGVTAVELMPVAQCPGRRNWGYDGVYPYSVQASYGGPDGLKRFVDACHQAGLAVVLDVVYNHLGPEGNYLRDFGPYFTDRYHTPWGEAIHYDGPDSGPVRHYFIQNALFWVTEYRIDALRLDATDTIYDFSARHFLDELAAAVHQRAEALNRRIYVLAESAANDVRWVRSHDLGGFGLDAQWNDDFHHALRRTLTGETYGYYRDYPHFQQLVRSLRDGFVYQGEYSAYRHRAHGSVSRDIPPSRFIVCCQNHDQVGNRMEGDRLGHTVGLQKLKLAAAWVLLSPYVPLIFMGEEYNETSPFPYFVDHGDRELVEAVREGRKSEFAAFQWEGEAPDPQSEETFLRAKLQPELRNSGSHAELFVFYRDLIRLRKQLAPLAFLSREGMRVVSDDSRRVIWVSRRFGKHECVMAFAFADFQSTSPFPFDRGSFRKHTDTRKPLATDKPTVIETVQLAHGAEIAMAPHSVLLFERVLPTIAD